MNTCPICGSAIGAYDEEIQCRRCEGAYHHAVLQANERNQNAHQPPIIHVCGGNQLGKTTRLRKQSK